MGKSGSKDGKDSKDDDNKKDDEKKRRSSLGNKPMPVDHDKKHGQKSVSMDSFLDVKVLGKGAFGEVRLCRKKDTKELLAVKIMMKKNLKESQIPRLLAERDLMAFADHEYIVALHYSFQDAEKLYLVMDFMQGGDLMGLLIEKDIFSVKATQFYIGELCLAVHSVHLLGYCHRDLKPDNVLLSATGHVKLADFGLAKKLKITVKAGGEDADKESPTENKEETKVDDGAKDNLADKAENWKAQKKTLAHSMVGTPDYMAPEIFTHNGYDEECDWWGVGCIMFECLAGYAPFYSGGDCDIQDTVRNVRNWDKRLNLEKVKKTDKNAADIISKLICHFKNRLNFDGITKHVFFKGFDWENSLENNEAPYHSEQLKDELDTRYFNYDSDDDDDDDDDAQVKEPIKKINDFTFYIETSEKEHCVSDLWKHPPTEDTSEDK